MHDQGPRLPSWLLADAQPGEAAGDGSMPWVPAIYIGDPDGVLGAWLWDGPPLTLVDIWR